MPAFLHLQDQWALTRTVKGYSSGTRVDLLNFTKANTAFISVISTREVLEVTRDDIVKLRDRHRIVPAENSRDRRRKRKIAATNDA
jgi:hypothetical protein